MIRWLGIGILLLGVTGFTECYRPAGRGTGLPRHIRTLAILPLENPSLRFKVEQRLTAALVNEVLRRSSSLTVTATPEGADAVMEGKVHAFSLRPTLLDDFGRARLSEVTITVGLTVRDLTKNRILFDYQNFTFRGEYEISGDPASFFSEEGPAVERIALDFARSVMTTLLEGF